MIGKEHYFFENLEEMDNEETISGFIKQYYMNNQNIPAKIMIKENLEEKEVIEQWLSDLRGKKVEIKSPQKGEKLRFVEMAENNAKVTLENRGKEETNILKELKNILQIEHLPKKIETFDISNISGEYMVAGMSVLYNGKVNKNLSRRFKIKTVFSQDDPKCMEEVITRRLKHSLENTNEGFGSLPDAIFVDGGITQIRAAKRAIQKYNLNIPVLGMVKDNKHRTRALINEEKEEFKLSEDLIKTITHFQDTVHNVAISYHRKLREKEMQKSKLDNIKGIGEVKKQELLKKFGSVEKIKDAKIEELTGINEKLAQEIKQNLK